jgi:hypothetical protein
VLKPKNGFGLALLSGLALLATACSRSDEGNSPSTSFHGPAKESLDDGFKPAAILDLPGGNTVEFVPIGSGVVVMETGAAGSPSLLNGENAPAQLAMKNAPREERLSAVWNSLAAGKALPKSLADIQVGWKQKLPMSRPTAAPALPGIQGEPFGSPINPALAKAAAPEGCDNGCCDYEWLKTFASCKEKTLDFQWMLYNYNWSSVNSTGIDVYAGFVCSAIGTSTWKVNIDGEGGAWSVKQATYKSWLWFAGFWDEDMKSSVNSSASPRLHTYCGNVSY